MWERGRKRSLGYCVTFTIPDRPLSKADLRGRRYAVKFGDFLTNKGVVPWLPKGRKLGFSLSWVRFDDLVREGETWGQSCVGVL
jgi:hypothetical protein